MDGQAEAIRAKPENQSSTHLPMYLAGAGMVGEAMMKTECNHTGTACLLRYVSAQRSGYPARCVNCGRGQALANPVEGPAVAGADVMQPAGECVREFVDGYGEKSKRAPQKAKMGRPKGAQDKAPRKKRVTAPRAEGGRVLAPRTYETVLVRTLLSVKWDKNDRVLWRDFAKVFQRRVWSEGLKPLEPCHIARIFMARGGVITKRRFWVGRLDGA